MITVYLLAKTCIMLFLLVALFIKVYGYVERKVIELKGAPEDE